MMKTRAIGLTKDAGWQIGVRKTFPVSVREVWDLLMSETGALIWLGRDKGLLLLPGEQFKTTDGISGRINVITPYSHLRLTWAKDGWERPSMLQVRVIGAGKKATLSFHQDKLADESTRQRMKTYWDNVMTRIESKLSKQ